MWLKKAKRINTDFAQWLLAKGCQDSLHHYLNASCFLEYVYRYNENSFKDLNKEDLMYFLHHYYTKVNEEYNYIKDCLPVSLELLFDYLSKIEKMKNLKDLLRIIKKKTIFESSMQYKADNSQGSEFVDELDDWWSEIDHLDWEKEFFETMLYSDSEFIEENNSDFYTEIEEFQKGELFGWLKMFYLEEVTKLSSGTRTKYEKVIDLYITCASRYGDLNKFYYEDFEEFISWWYLKKYFNASITEVKNIFLVFNKFAKWMSKKGQLYLHTDWCQGEVDTLRKDILRVLSWQKNKKIIANNTAFSQTQTSRTKLLEEGYFQVRTIIEGKAIISCLINNIDYKVSLYGKIREYLKPGDCLSASIFKDSQSNLILADYDVSTLYPPQAEFYLQII